MKITLEQIAEYVNGVVEGDNTAEVTSFAPIEKGEPGKLSFLSNEKYEHYLYKSRATGVLVNKSLRLKSPVETNLIRVDNAYEALAKLMQLADQFTNPKRKGVNSLASISPKAKIADDVYIGPFAVIEDGATIEAGVEIYPHAYVGKDVTIKSNTIIYAAVVIYQGCIIGSNCIIHAGAKIGADGFGFSPTENGYQKIPQLGSVRIEDNVEIGANTCIDRATMDETVIDEGVKLDNLIQIAHNCAVGKHSVIAAQTGVAGSSRLGDWSVIGGQVGIAGHLNIGDHVTMGAQSGVISNIKENTTIMGSPTMPLNDFMRSNVVFRKLPDLLTRIETLEKELAKLKVPE